MYRIWVLIVCYMGGVEGKIPSYPLHPSISEIARCSPETMQSMMKATLNQMPKIGRIVSILHKEIHYSFQKNCEQLTRLLKKVGIKKILQHKNIAPEGNDKNRRIIFKKLEDSHKGFVASVKILSHLDTHIIGYINALHTLLNVNYNCTLIDFINVVNLVQTSALELVEIFHLYRHLELPRQKIQGYDAILDGLFEQLLKYIILINRLSQATQDIRNLYISQLYKGDCGSDQIANALGIFYKKQQAQKNEQ